MKSFSVLIPALAGVALAYPQHSHGAPEPKAVGIKVEPLKAQFGSEYKRVKVTYGKYTLPPFNASGGMAHPGMEHEGGMLNGSNKKAPKPCSDCTLKYAVASLNYPDGRVANFQSGSWLHHLTMAVVGPGRVDVACPGGTQRIPKNMERMLAIHNDRNETFFGVTGNDKMGYYLGKEDEMDLELVLKNEVNIPKDVVFSIDWEFIPGKAAGFADVKGIWMDAAPCTAMMSDIEPPKDKKKFTISGPEWVSTVNGKLLNTVGHMHDGGVEVQIHLNDKAVCKSQAQYGTNPEYEAGPEAIKNGAKSGLKHISRYTPCIAIGDIKKGDKLKLSATYDFDTWKPALNKMGAESHVMGVAMLFVQVKS